MTLIIPVNVYSFIILISLCIFSFIHRRTNTLLKSILKCVQDYRGVPRKPAVFPLSSVEEMDEFENADEDCYTDVVSEKNNKIDLSFSSPSSFLSLSLSLSLFLCVTVKTMCLHMYLISVLGELFALYRRLQFKRSGKSLPKGSFKRLINTIIYMVGP